MDPIHPIAPVAPTIPPVTPAPIVGRIDRENPRRRPARDQPRRRRPQAGPGSGADEQAEFGYAADERDSGDDSGLHINVTA